MSKLDDLIDELCPDGMEYKRLGDFASVIRGGNFQKKDFVENGKPCIHYGQMYTHFKNTTNKTLTFVSDSVFEKSKQAQPNDIVMAVTSENVEDVCSCVAWLGKENIAVSGHTAIIHHNQNPSYLSYYFHSELFFKQKVKLAHGTKVIEVTPDKLLGIEIPVPPLEVQNEIIRILDKFTSLEAELEAELEARRKQYEYYRDSLLKNTKIEKTVTIKDIAEMVTVGIANSATHAYSENGIIMFRNQNIKENHLDDSDLIYIKEEFESKYKNKRLKANDILVSRTGYPGQACVVPEKYENCQTFTTLILRLKKELDINPRYVCFYINSKEGKKYVEKVKTGAAQSNFNAGSLEEMPISLPSIEEQDRIVAILDRFESLCNDITSGLPAEIEARHKQYEYYRDKLLTFKRKEV